MGQFLPGTDFVTSGYSVMPRRDNTFGGGNFDADDLDEWLTVQRDWQVDAGIEPVSEEEVLRVRERAAHAVQAVFEELELPPVSNEEVAAATTGYDSSEMPDRDRAADVEAADELLARGVSGLDVALALDHRGFGEIAEAVVSMQRQRVSADYLQTSAVIDAQALVHSAVNDPNVYSGPGTGYRLEGERWELLQSLPNVVDPAELLGSDTEGEPVVVERGEAAKGDESTEVVVAVGPAFADAIRKTINDLSHRDVLESICDGIRAGGATPRVVRVRRVADVAFIAHDGARLSGSGVALGIQSKGTAVIHRADLEPLDNLELFGMSPLYTLESYRAMGRNAAGYALGQRVGPVPTELDNFARAKLIVKTTLLHARETQAVQPGGAAVEIVLGRCRSPRAEPPNRHYGFRAEDGTRLLGTLVRPAASDPQPAALLLIGSGPLDRNSNMLGQALNLANALASALAARRRRIASLRQGRVGQSGGDYLTTGFDRETRDASSALAALESSSGDRPRTTDGRRSLGRCDDRDPARGRRTPGRRRRAAQRFEPVRYRGHAASVGVRIAASLRGPSRLLSRWVLRRQERAEGSVRVHRRRDPDRSKPLARALVSRVHCL